jgi:ribonuclease P protein component
MLCKAYCSFFILKKRPSTSGSTRVFFGFSRRIGKAVTRNRFKRRIREIVRLYAKPSSPCVLFFAAKRSLEKMTKTQWLEDKKRLKEWCESL